MSDSPAQALQFRSDDVEGSEAWVTHQAERLSKMMRSDKRNAHIPDYATTVEALAVVMCGAWNLPCYRKLADAALQRHREDNHAGGRTSACEACGYFEGAVYKAQHGREFIDDFPELFPRQS